MKQKRKTEGMNKKNYGVIWQGGRRSKQKAKKFDTDRNKTTPTP